MFSAAEYEARRYGLSAALITGGLAGAVVVSRGGSTFDRYADVFYLTGHYQSYSYLPDAPGLFSGRAHTALVIDANGDVVLCVSVPEIDRATIAATDIRHSDDFVATLASALADLKLDRKKLGIVGGDVLPMHYWIRLKERVPNATWVECDDLVFKLRRIKSPAEQAVIRKAADIHRRGMTKLLAEAQPGRAESELVAALAETVIAEGCGLYFASVASGENTARYVSQAMPGFSRRKLKAGDIMRCDIGVVYQGYLSDFGRSVIIGEPNAEQLRLLCTLRTGLDAAIAAVRPSATVKSVVAAGEAALMQAGVVASDRGDGSIVSSFPVHWGHGLGLGWERPWMTETEDMTIEPGMYLAIERALSMPGVGTVAGEQNVLVLEDRVDVLTEGPDGRWS